LSSCASLASCGLQRLILDVVAIALNQRNGGCRVLAEFGHLTGGLWIERVCRRQQTDDRQHDEANAFLTVIGAVRKADRGTRENQQPS
jgi:hypothetical protein